MRQKLLWVLFFSLSLITAISVYFYLQKLEERYRQKGDFQPVVVAKERIPARTPITASMLEIKYLPPGYLSGHFLTETREALGKITRTEILQGEILRQEKLVTGKEATNELAFLVTPGKRAVTIAVNDVSGLAGLLRPGDRVDILATLEVSPGPGQDKVSTTSLVVQNVEVLSVDQSLENTPSSLEGKKQGGQRNITLLVTPKQAQSLVLSSEKGSLRLLLRSPSDREPIYLPPLKIYELLSKPEVMQ
ncbi:pilus assembly protein CpaB [Thermanaeromonas toyohensis ToBE]|uniref:Pilus assembly protein CpaB n=1 Tax=Thermanaeromonas toyohensis ToBE TaxID=698762 RepID=A0A1W1VNC5_9FIRM|nr:Flp pilus assembly protein CpaB [Thermanaeromonas toyohensis]SMB94885.1 pilus assembly protein CpaB [Thermanaeromonas toyohensis ToBE]